MKKPLIVVATFFIVLILMHIFLLWFCMTINVQMSPMAAIIEFIFAIAASIFVLPLSGEEL